LGDDVEPGFLGVERARSDIDAGNDIHGTGVKRVSGALR
jgi:hypothetical protein